MADLGNGKYLVWLGTECFTVAVGSEVDQVAKQLTGVWKAARIPPVTLRIFAFAKFMQPQ